MKKKIVSLMLIAIMALSTLAGCGDQNKETTAAPTDKGTEAPGTEAPGTEAPTDAPTDAPKVEVTYPLEEKVKLTIAIPSSSNVTAICTGYAETPFFKELQKRTGVEIEFVEVASKDMNLLFAEDPLPDIIYSYNMATSYPGGIAAALEDEVIIPITEYLDECAPDYKAVLEAKPVGSRVVCVGDEVVGFANYPADKYKATYGMVIRQDWLDDLKMEVPTNADELYTVLKAFKEKKGATYPLSPWSSYVTNGLLNMGMITSSFNLVNTDYHLKDGKIVAGFIQDEARDVLEYLHKLYEEELLDPNFAATDNATQMANFTGGVSGMCVLAVSSGLTPVVNAVADNPDFKIAPMEPLKTPDGSIAMYSVYGAEAGANGAFITSDCKNVEAAVKFLNYGYTEEGMLLYNFGIEGESYEMVNGVPQYTDVITNNPNMNKTQAAWQYTRVLVGSPKIQMNEYLTSYNPGEIQKAAFENWAVSNAKDHAIPTLVMLGDMATEHTNLESDLSAYKSEMYVKFINGTESLDNWDAFVAQCKALKVDRIVEIKQQFYDEQYGK